MGFIQLLRKKEKTIGSSPTALKDAFTYFFHKIYFVHSLPPPAPPRSVYTYTAKPQCSGHILVRRLRVGSEVPLGYAVPQLLGFLLLPVIQGTHTWPFIYSGGKFLLFASPQIWISCNSFFSYHLRVSSYHELISSVPGLCSYIVTSAWTTRGHSLQIRTLLLLSGPL